MVNHNVKISLIDKKKEKKKKTGMKARWWRGTSCEPTRWSTTSWYGARAKINWRVGVKMSHLMALFGTFGAFWSHYPAIQVTRQSDFTFWWLDYIAVHWANNHKGEIIYWNKLDFQASAGFAPCLRFSFHRADITSKICRGSRILNFA